MKRKTIAIVIGLTMLAVCTCYLQFGRNMDVANSFSLNSKNYREENINVILNRLIVTENKEEIATTIIQRVLMNDFHSIKFSFICGYPHRLDVSVYKSKKDFESDNLLFSFSYSQASGEIGAYDISQREYMKLKMSD